MKKRNPRRWTPQEFALLKSLHKKKVKMEKICKMLNRNEGSIRNKLSYNGIRNRYCPFKKGTKSFIMARLYKELNGYTKEDWDAIRKSIR